jgi:hypothetical protein
LSLAYADEGCVPWIELHLSVYNLDTLDAMGEIPRVSAVGAAVDPQSQHGFSTSKPVIMWGSNTVDVIRTIDIEGRRAGILFDPFNRGIWVSATLPRMPVIDASDGSIVKTLELGDAPEQAVSGGKGAIYVNLTDKTNLPVIHAKALTVEVHFDMTSKGSNAGGLAFDEGNHILFSYIHQPTSMAVVGGAVLRSGFRGPSQLQLCLSLTGTLGHFQPGHIPILLTCSKFALFGRIGDMRPIWLEKRRSESVWLCSQKRTANLVCRAPKL